MRCNANLKPLISNVLIRKLREIYTVAELSNSICKPCYNYITSSLLRVTTRVNRTLNNCYVRINQRGATLLMNDLYFPLFGSKCFGLSQTYHQENHLINCITHCAGILARLACTNIPIRCTFYEMMLVIMDW